MAQGHEPEIGLLAEHPQGPRPLPGGGALEDGRIPRRVAQPVAQPAPAPQEDSDSGDDEDIATEAIAPQPRISLEPSREVRPPNGFSPAESVPEESADDAPLEPSIFRSLGRALRRGLTDTVRQTGGEDTSSEPAADPQTSETESPEQ